MEKLLDRITAAVSEAFVNCGYEAEYGKVTISNRPDLCEELWQAQKSITAHPFRLPIRWQRA